MFSLLSCTVAKWWCIHQPVNSYTNCLERCLICAWLYCSQHDKFKIHGFEIKFFYSVFVNTAKFSIKNFFSNCDQIRRKLPIWSHLLKKSLMENFIFAQWKLNQIKINKACVKLQAYVTLKTLCTPWIQSEIRRNVYENVKI